MTVQHLPQSTLDEAELKVATIGKPAELSVSNVRGQGALVLRLRQGASGITGSWMIRFNEGTERPTIPLGSYSRKGVNGLSLTLAKQQFDAWVAQREEGVLLVKPKGRAAHAMRTREQLAPIQQHLTVRALVNCYLDEYAAKVNTANTVRTNRYMFDAHLGKLGLAERRAKDVEAKDIQAVVNLITEEAGPAQADRFRATMRAIYNMAAKASAGVGRAEIPKAFAEFGIEGHNLKLIDRVPGAQKVRKKPMSGEMLPLVYAQLGYTRDDLGGRPTVPLLRATLRLSLLLGGTRFEQVNRLERKDFCFLTHRVNLTDAKGRHDKEAREYQLPLTATAIQVAKEMLAERDKGYALGMGVFGAAMRRAMQRAGLETADGKPHQGRDVRSTIASWWNMREQNVRREIQNYVQSHGQMIEDRHYIEGGMLEQEAREALEKLETLLLGRAQLKLAA